MKDISPARFEQLSQLSPPLKADVFERLAQQPPPIPADEMAKLAEPHLPRQGYVSDYDAMTAKGRTQIAEDAGKRGEQMFPPAREVVE